MLLSRMMKNISSSRREPRPPEDQLASVDTIHAKNWTLQKGKSVALLQLLTIKLLPSPSGSSNDFNFNNFLYNNDFKFSKQLIII